MGVKVAVAGLGWWGKQIIRSLGSNSGFKVVAAFDPFPPEDAADFLKHLGIELVLDFESLLLRDDLEGIILATPHSVHEEQVLKVLASGKQVFCEKPLAMTPDGARKMLGEARKRGRVLGIGHERRFEPAVAKMMQMVRNGELGKILHVEANVSHDLFRKLDASNWRLNQQHAPAGMLTAVGIHVTDMFVSMVGPAESVNCSVDTLIFNPPAKDYMSASIKFRSGARGLITCLSATPFYGRITVFGDQGWIELVSKGNVDKGLPTIFTYCKDTTEPREEISYEANDAVSLNFESWRQAALTGSCYPFAHEELLENIKLFEALVQSGNQGGKTVEIELEG